MKYTIYRSLLLFLLLLMCTITWAKRTSLSTTEIETSSLSDSLVTIKGKIVDNKGNALIGATIFFPKINNGFVSNEKGEFNVKLRSGLYTYTVSYVGSKPFEGMLDTRKSKKLYIQMNENVELEEVVITAEKQDENVTQIGMGAHALSLNEIAKMPAMMGEVDVVKAIQLLPGVQQTSDGGSGFSVRGGGWDQNLILLDNSTIYNASHLLGIFSVFNNDFVQGVELYKGDMPLRYGGRLSSLLKVRTSEKVPSRFEMNGGLGLISSRLTLSVPVTKTTFFIIGGRRSYADLFMKMNNKYKDSDLYFYDANFKLTHILSPKQKLELMAYHGKDQFGMGGKQIYYYGNLALSLNWKNLISERFSYSVEGGLVRYGYCMESKLKNNEMKWTSNITDYSLNVHFNSILSERLTFNYGVSATLHRFNPGLVTQPNYKDFRMPTRNAFECSAYIENQFKITPNLSAKYGLRITSFSNIGEALIYRFDSSYHCVDSTMYRENRLFGNYTRVEPRIGLLYRLNQHSSLKADYVHNVQFIQIANNSAAGSPLDMWFCAGPNVKPQEADIYSLGYFKNYNENMYEFSCETYYKKITHSIDFADHAELLLNEKMEGEIRSGKGDAYGVELMLKKNKGALTGFVNYTLSRSTRKFKAINEGKRYLSPYDKTHFINASLAYRLNRKHSFSAIFVYATGAPTTYPIGRMEIDGEYYPIYSKRNEYRKPNYHRLDLSWSYTPSHNQQRKWKDEWVFSLFNAYNQHNPWTISYNTDEGTPFAEKVYLFGILPSVTYNFKF